MSSSDGNIRGWITDNWLVLSAIVILGGFPLISIYPPLSSVLGDVIGEFSVLEVVLAALMLDVILVAIFHRERRRWLDKYRYRGSVLLIVGFILFIGVLTAILAPLGIAIILAALIGALVPATQYAYNQIIKRPSIQIKSLEIEDAKVAPMYSQELPHLGRPAIFLKLDVENTGQATAENCTIKFWYERDGEEVESSYARWAIPEADERYNLLPDESLSVHVLKIFITKDFFVLKELTNAEKSGKSAADLSGKWLNIPGNPDGKIRMDTNWDRHEPKKEDIENQMCFYHPTRKPPEQTESVRGGWVGNEIPAGEYTLHIQPLAENYKKPRETLLIRYTGDNTLNLRTDEVSSLLVNDSIEWQDQWDDKGYTDFKEQVKECCQEIIE